MVDKYKGISFTEDNIIGYKNRIQSYEKLRTKRKEKVGRLLEIGEEIYIINEKVREISKGMIGLKNKRIEKNSKEIALNKIKKQIQIIEKTIEYIKMTSEEIKTNMYPAVLMEINKNISNITKNYNEVIIDEKSNILLKNIEGETLLIEDLSLGTVDQVYFAIRIGLMKSFGYEGEIAIVLDDAFVQYDIDRFNNVMDVIFRLKEQVILLTCYDREKQYAKEYPGIINYFEI